MNTTARLLAAAAVAAALSGAAVSFCAAATFIEGPVYIKTVRVVDGDSFVAEAEPFPDVTFHEDIRILDIDAPEVRGKCQQEKDMAAAATKKLTELLTQFGGDAVKISDISRDKYGRVLAHVRVGGQDVGQELIRLGLAVPYRGQGQKHDWCAGRPAIDPIPDPHPDR